MRLCLQPRRQGEILWPSVRHHCALQWLGLVDSSAGGQIQLLDSRDLSWIWDQVRNWCPASRYLVEGREGTALPALGGLLGKAGLHRATFRSCESSLTPWPCNIPGVAVPSLCQAVSLPLPLPPRLTQTQTCSNTGCGFLAAERGRGAAPFEWS